MCISLDQNPEYARKSCISEITNKTPRRGESETLSCTILKIEAPGLEPPEFIRGSQENASKIGIP
jgi:hypothetical protein